MDDHVKYIRSIATVEGTKANLGGMLAKALNMAYRAGTGKGIGMSSFEEMFPAV